MYYDHVISASDSLSDEWFHLACGYRDTTSFLFEQAGFAVVIHCRGEFTFYSPDGTQLGTVQARPMTTGRECYMDVMISTHESSVTFRLPDYSWTDHYPNCDSESDRWDARIVGIRDEVRYPPEQ